MPDPERFARHFAPAGAALIVFAVAASQWWVLPAAGLGVLLLVASCWSREDGFLLFGPFVSQEARAVVRRSRVHVWRTVVVSFAAAAFTGAAAVRQFNPSPSAVQNAGTALVLVTAYLTILIVLPVGMTALQASVAGEREAKRLDFLLVTDLRNREIIFGRGLGRGATVLALGLAILPFAAAVPPFFGVPVGLVTVPFAYAAVTFLSSAGLMLYASTVSRTVKRTNPSTTIVLFPFFLVTMGLEALRFTPSVWAMLFDVPGYGLVAAGDLLEYVSAANPLAIVIRVGVGATGGLDPLDVAAEWLPVYAAYHLAFFFLGTFRSCEVLRRVSADLAGVGPVGSTASGGRQLAKPVVTDRPILWKERHFHELLPKTNAGRRTSRVVGWLLGYLPGIAILVIGLLDIPEIQRSVSSALRGILPLLVWILVCAAMRISSGVFARERERDTLTSLVMTPIPPAEIVYEKWLGCLLVQGGGFAWLLLIGGPAALTGLYPWWAFLGLFAMTVAYQCAGASVGVLASVGGTKTEKAGQNAMVRGLLGVAVQSLLAAIPLTLALSGVWPDAKYGTVVLCPFSFLIALGFVDACPPSERPLWAVATLLGILHMLLISRLVYCRARAKFERMCADGTVDTGGSVVR
jgi:ABC-type Na+ efflux pump permease subunit